LKLAWNDTASERPSLSFPGIGYFWLLCFAYSSCTALLMQKLFLPMWPAMHAGHGLLKGDAIIFHNQALQIAQQIQTVGWSAWSLLPSGGSANIGLLSALYVIFTPDPAWFIPFNAAAHATGALMIYRMGTAIADSNAGRLGGLLTAICFLVFPSALLWYGQIHKDAFTIAGTLLVLNSWLALDGNGKAISLNRFSYLILMVLLGVVLVGIFRPYHVLLILLGLLASLVVILPSREKIVVTSVRSAMIFVVAMSAFMFTSVSSPSNDYVYGSSSVFTEFKWQENDYLPARLDKAFRRASELRQHFVDFGISVGAESGIDNDVVPRNAQDAIEYLPRALFIGLFSPFPTTWGERMSAPRLVAAMETAAWYLMVLGTLATLLRFRSRNLFAGVFFCATVLTIIAYVSPNIGTLYRLRYGLWFFFALIGTIGWSNLLLEYLPGVSKASQSQKDDPSSDWPTLPDTQTVVHKSGSGPVVMLLALVLFLGFLTRDLLLVDKFGFTDEVDLFFAISAISMFFVNSLSVPLGDAFVPVFVAAQRLEVGERVRLLRVSLGFALLLVTLAWIAIVTLAPWLVSFVLGSHPADKQADAVDMLRWFSIIVLLSSFTIIGNSVLNSLGKPIQSAQAQLVVPFLTLTAVIIAPQNDAVYAAIAGMVIGTFVNAIVVGWRVRVLGYSFMPSFPNGTETQIVRSQYWPLLAAAVLPAMLVPLNYYFAATAGSGTLSAWAISSKIVTLFASLANVVATAVILPRLSYSFRVVKRPICVIKPVFWLQPGYGLAG